MTAGYEQVVRALRTAFETGKTKPIAYRKLQLQGILRLCTENVDAICEAVQKDLRKSKAETIMMEIDCAKNEILCALENIESWERPEKAEKSLATLMDELYIYNDPLGVVLIIGAWNYPFQLSLIPLVGAIAGGNAAILKPSEVSPNTATLIKKLFPKYLDSDTYQVKQQKKIQLITS